MFSAGQVSAVLEGRFSPAGFVAFDAAMRRAKSSMDDVEKKGGALHRTMATVGKVGAGTAAVGIFAVGAALVKSAKLAAGFEEQMSRLKATTGANSTAMAQFKKDALAAGAATKFSALDAAKAQVELAKGGLSVAKMGGGLKAALALAAAGELDLAQAAETTVNAMKQFSLGGGEAMHIADALATAANTTTVDVGDLALALRAGGGVAAMAGASFDETVAAISALADASVRGSDAGTSLKSFFLNIATPSKKAAEAMQGLGLNIFTATGDLKPMPALAASVRDAFSGLTKEQFLSKAGTIAGSDAARALFAIYKAGPAGMERYLEAQKEVGTAAATAATKQDNLRGKIENLKGSLETAGIQLGEGLLPGLTKGAEQLTAVINDMSASGDLTKIGEAFGSMISTIVSGLPTAVDAARSFARALPGAFDATLGVLTSTADAVVLTIKAFNLLFKVGSFGLAPQIDTNGIEDGIDGVNAFRDSLRGVRREVANPMPAKVAKIAIANDTTVKQKIRQIEALGIKPKVAKIIASGGPETLREIAMVNAALGGIRDKTVRITSIASFIQDDSKRTTKKRPTRAAGRGPGSTETALVGEGRGPELVGNPTAGWQVVDKPTLMGLGPEDSVIPYGDPKYAGRALGLMLAAMGVPGYAAGRTAFGRSLSTGRATPAAKKKLAIPAAVRFGSVPEDQLGNERDDARERYQKRKERVRDLDVDIRAQQRKVREAKAGPAKRKAQAKLSDLQRDRRKYQDGGDGLASVAVLRKRWTDLREQALVLHRTNLEIERLNTLQENDRTRMVTASQRGDATAWGAARTRRGSTLDKLRALYARAVRYAKPGSNFAAELEGKLAGVEGDIAAAAGEEFEQEETEGQKLVREASERLFETGMTDEERAGLAGIDAEGALAELTDTLDDDRAAAGRRYGFFENILRAVQADPARGGNAAVADIAGQLKAAKDSLSSLVGDKNAGPDLQAQLDQAREEVRIAQRESQINSRALSVFQGWNGGQPQIVQNINTLHPGDPATQRAVGDAAVAGMSYQATQTSPRTNLGL